MPYPDGGSSSIRNVFSKVVLNLYYLSHKKPDIPFFYVVFVIKYLKPDKFMYMEIIHLTHYLLINKIHIARH